MECGIKDELSKAFALITLVKIYHARKRIGNRQQRGDCGTFGSMISIHIQWIKGRFLKGLRKETPANPGRRKVYP